MKQNQSLKVYNFSHLLLHTEVTAILGDKFIQSLPIFWEITSDIEKSNVIIWDGLITTKNKVFVDKVIEEIKKGRVLLLLRDNARNVARSVNLEGLNYVELSSWSALPEEILLALNECHKKLSNV